MIAASLALGSAQVAQAQGSPTCHGHFPNPITDICWDCFFPLSIGGFDLWPSDKPDPGNPSLPVCLCGIRPGLSFGFWEPVRLIDVTTKPFCFPNLGGLTINPGMYVGNGHVSAPSQKGGNTQMSPSIRRIITSIRCSICSSCWAISSALSRPRSIWPI
jgi:conjugal transfer pilus assembly protein TraU